MDVVAGYVLKEGAEDYIYQGKLIVIQLLEGWYLTLAVLSSTISVTLQRRLLPSAIKKGS